MTRDQYLTQTMKKILLVASVLGVASLPAMAADTAVELPVASIYDWSGFYVGAQVGYGWVNANRVAILSGFENSFDANGLIGGVHVGANYQSGSFVYGAEADVVYSGIEGDDAAVGGVLDRINIGWMGSLRARAGYAWDRILIYGTGGVAFANLEADGNNFEASDENTHIGWTVGAGAEFALNENWTTRVEYRFTDFGDKTYIFEPEFLDANYDVQLSTVRVGLTYNF